MRRLALILVALVCAGCGPGAGSEADAPTGVNTVVTRDFGASELRDVDSSKVPPGETVMRYLQRKFTVETRYGGGFVQSLEGLAGGKDADGRPVDWFYYVNGIESGEGAAARKLTAGDRIWWDRHDWGAAQRIPAVVGSWPEPFLSGQDGKRLPLVLMCAGEERSCDEVQTRLSDEGVTGISRTGIGAGVGQKLLRVVVGPWDEIRGEPAAQSLERGPSATGVFARPSGDGFELLDERGEVAQKRTDSIGLVAATRFQDQQPTWIVTGTDDAGVAAAAAALRSDVLTNRFAVALIDGKAENLPIRQDP